MMARRFYVSDVAECMGVDPERIVDLCNHWGIKIHGRVVFLDMTFDGTWLSWTGVQTLARMNWRGKHFEPGRFVSSPKDIFLTKVWAKKRD